MKTKKVALGMSGGVDSSVCAALLKERGYEVTGVFLECWRAPGCRSEQDRKDALSVALQLDIPFQVLDFKQAYRDSVVEHFFNDYQAGLTPNPDILCNSVIKFGLFYDWVIKNGFDYCATGHYAKIISDGSTNLLVIPQDTHKDQTYFLHTLKQEQLGHILFPLQDLTKQEVRALAAEKNLPVATKKDSVGICFIGDINVHSFLKERLGENPGAVVDTAGNVIGSHQGLWFYTVGQRTGFTVSHKSILKSPTGEYIEKQNIPPFYVIRKEPVHNQLVVGFGTETLQSSCTIAATHWITQPIPQEKLFVRIRHTGKLLACTLQGDTVLLDEPTQGIAAGQSAVFYQEVTGVTVCLGGGVITES